MVPLIITSQNEAETTKYLSEHDLLKNIMYELNREDSLKIEDVKDLIHLFNLSSSKQRTFLIRQADNLTLPAQNALLKTLEEHRSLDQIILSVRNQFSLLDTIRSRCTQINLISAQDPVDSPIAQKILQSITSSTTEMISLTDEILKNDPNSAILSFIKLLRIRNQQHPTAKRVAIINLALCCLKDLKNNLNPKLAVDHFLLKSNQLIKMNPVNA